MIKNFPTNATIAVAMLFNSCIRTCFYHVVSWRVSITVPLVKPGKDVFFVQNVTLINIFSNISKVFLKNTPS